MATLLCLWILLNSETCRSCRKEFCFTQKYNRPAKSKGPHRIFYESDLESSAYSRGILWNENTCKQGEKLFDFVI